MNRDRRIRIWDVYSLLNKTFNLLCWIIQREEESIERLPGFRKGTRVEVKMRYIVTGLDSARDGIQKALLTIEGLENTIDNFNPDTIKDYK